MDIVTKKINNQFIFYDKDIEINIEELFLSNAFESSEKENVVWLNNDTWVKKHYVRKGKMSFLNDNYLYSRLKQTRSYREFEILNYLYKHNFDTCKPLVGWVTYNGIAYKANLVTEAINARPLDEILSLLFTGLGVVDMSIFNSSIVKYERPRLLKEIGAKVAQMHNLNVFHGDLNISNILISRDSITNKKVVWILDFDKSFVKDLREKDRMSNLDRFYKSLVKNGYYLDSDYTEFVTGYNSVINR